VVAVPHGVGEQFRPRESGQLSDTRAAYGLADDYLLVVGSLQPRKNLERLLRVWRRLRPRWPSLLLALVGGSAPGCRRTRVEATPGVGLLGPVPDHDLPALYSGAHGFVLPSLYEGFGLPLLEAMASGVPAAVSNAAALPEVAAGAAVLMDPRDEESMAAALQRLVEDRTWRAGAVEAGRARAAAFSWERAAELTWGVLREASEEAS
jgi:alpha-1,3-rhamnosyl/mannosyltransferase